MSTCKKLTVLFTTCFLFIFSVSRAETGMKEVYTIQLSDTLGKRAWLPYIGEYPVVIVYEDFRNAGDTRELYTKSIEKPDLYNKIKIIYISNTAPAWYIPDSMIYTYFRRREKVYSNINFLIDTSRSLQIKWRIADTEGKTVIILVSRDAKIIDIIYKIPEKNEFEKFIDRVTDVLDF